MPPIFYPPMKIWIGFTGYARTGKSTAAEIIKRRFPQFEVVSLGDLIKESANPVLLAYLGISAFTEDPEEKSIIRNFLVHHGYHWYKVFLDRYKARVEHVPYLINPRVFRLEEALWWKRKGGLLVELQAEGVGPAEPKEREELELVRSAGLIDLTLTNPMTYDGLDKALEEKLYPRISLLQPV